MRSGRIKRKTTRWQMETIAIKGHLRGVDQYAYIGVLAPRL